MLDNGKVCVENDVLAVGVGLWMELFAKCTEMSETPAKVEPGAEGLTREERDALAVLKQLTLGPGRHAPLATLIARWGTRGSAESLLKAWMRSSAGGWRRQVAIDSPLPSPNAGDTPTSARGSLHTAPEGSVLSKEPAESGGAC